jgi:hypothetical protein
MNRKSLIIFWKMSGLRLRVLFVYDSKYIPREVMIVSRMDMND